MSRKHVLSHDLSLAAVDKHPDVAQTHRRAVEPLGRIDRSRLQGWTAQEFEAARDEADEILREFEQAYPGEAAAHRDEARTLRTAERVRRAVVALALLLVVVTVFQSFWAAVILLIIVLAANTAARRIISSRASRLALASQLRAVEAIDRLGETPVPGEPTGGAAARIDALYLRTLTEIERMTETQRRQTEQQMRLQEQRHQEQMAAMNKTLEAQKLVLAEEREQNDLRVGPRGFIGSFLTTRDRMRDDQRLR